LRKPAEYPVPSYRDPQDMRLLSIIKNAARAMPRAVNILGVPFDGAVLGRKGAAGGPRGIRQAMAGFSNFNVELGVGLEGARIYDLGDVVVDPSSSVTSVHADVQKEVSEGIVPTSLLIVLGGDNSVSLPALRASGKKLGEIGLIVVDSHLDLRGKIGGRPTSGSSYGLAIETVPGLDPERVVEIGIHGFLNSRRYVEKARRLGIEVFTASDVRDKGARSIAKEALRLASAGAESVYLSVDLDAVDLGQVPGVSAPSVGGISGNELLGLVYEIVRNGRVHAADIVELAPSLDPTGSSQRVAASALTYMIAGFSSRK
jgi:formimidoylglutamase